MCSYKSDPNHMVIIVYLYDQSVFVSFDIKYHPIIFQKAGAWIFLFNVFRRFPFFTTWFLKPRLQLLLTVGMFFPKFSKYFLWNDPQLTFLLSKIVKSSRIGKWFLEKITFSPCNKHSAKFNSPSIIEVKEISINAQTSAIF